jgi:hypothetical protein
MIDSKATSNSTVTSASATEQDSLIKQPNKTRSTNCFAAFFQEFRDNLKEANKYTGAYAAYAGIGAMPPVR